MWVPIQGETNRCSVCVLCRKAKEGGAVVSVTSAASRCFTLSLAIALMFYPVDLPSLFLKK